MHRLCNYNVIFGISFHEFKIYFVFFISGIEMPQVDSFGSTDTIDQLCSLTLNLVEDLNQMKDRMQDSGCESIH